MRRRRGGGEGKGKGEEKGRRGEHLCSLADDQNNPSRCREPQSQCFLNCLESWAQLYPTIEKKGQHVRSQFSGSEFSSESDIL